MVKGVSTTKQNSYQRQRTELDRNAHPTAGTWAVRSVSGVLLTDDLDLVCVAIDDSVRPVCSAVLMSRMCDCAVDVVDAGRVAGPDWCVR